MMRCHPSVLTLFATVLIPPLVGCDSKSSTPAAPNAGIADQEKLQREALKTLPKRGNGNASVEKLSPIKN